MSLCVSGSLIKPGEAKGGQGLHKLNGETVRKKKARTSQEFADLDFEGFNSMEGEICSKALTSPVDSYT